MLLLPRSDENNMYTIRRLTILLALFLGLSAGQSVWAVDKLVVLGDSISAGHGVEGGSGWVDLFKEKLAATGSSIEVVNESISGEVTAGGLARLPDILARVEPTWLVIELGGNDGLRGLSPKAMEKNLADMVTMAKQENVKVFLFGMKLPPNYGKQYNRLFEKTFVKIADAHEVPLLPFFLEGVGGMEQLMQSDRIHPNKQAQGVLLNNAWEFLHQYLK